MFMKILVVCQYYYPEEFRINDICEELVRQSHDVLVVTGLPNYPTGVVPSDYRFLRKRNEIVNGVKVLRNFEVGRGKGKFRLALNYVSFMISASIRTLFIGKGYDLVLVYQLSPISMVVPGLVYKWLHKVPMVIYSCDMWPLSLLNYIPNENNLIYKMVEIFSRKMYEAADRIIVSSNSFIDYFGTELNIKEDKMFFLPSHAEDVYSDKRTRIDNGVIDIVFAGNIGKAQDLMTLFDALLAVRHKDKIKVHIVGDGSELLSNKKYCIDNQLDKYVVFYGRKTVNEVADFYQLADICIVTLTNDSRIGLTIPSKVQSYMAAKKAILGAIDGETKEIINTNRIGIIVNSGDSEALTDAIENVIKNPSLIAEFELNSYNYYLANYKKDIFIKKLMVHLHEALGGNKNV